MYRLAILGCENSHADSFLDFVLKDGLYPDIEIAGVYSDDPAAIQRMTEKYGVYCMTRPDELVGKVDAIAVTARHGKHHYPYAKPYIASGIPMFIDKPITVDDAEAVELMTELKNHGCRVTGGSSLAHSDEIKSLAATVTSGEHGKLYGGFLRAPVSLENAYGGFYFYCQHLTEMTTTVFGKNPTSVLAHQNGKAVNATVTYPDFDVNIQFVDGNYQYAAYASTEKGVIGGKVNVERSAFLAEFDELVRLIRGEAQTRSYRDLLAPVFLSNAIKRSLDSGRTENITAVEEI